jgi:hypothetical protein
MQKDIHKEVFHVCGWSCKAVHNWVPKTSLIRRRFKRRCGSCRDNSQKNFYAAGSQELVKRWDKFINVGGGYVGK